MTGRPCSLLAVHQGGGIGGAPVSLIALLAGLDRGEFVPRVAFTENGPILEEARAGGVPTTVVPTGGAFYYSAHARLGPRMLARFVRTFPRSVQLARAFLRQERPEVLHLNTSVLLAWAAAARREDVPVLWMVREVLGPDPRLRAWHARYVLRHARQVVAISRAAREPFPPGARVDVVYNAVDLQQFTPALTTEREAVRTEIGLAPGAQAIVALGSVQRAKGHWLLLEAFARLAPSFPEARLVLVCGGVDAAYAETLRGRAKRLLGRPLDNLDALLHTARAAGLADRVLVTGFRRDVARVLTAADVVAFPSLAAEGFGRPIIEAMAMQRPVVATGVGPSAEILGSEAGLLVPPVVPDLAEALASILRAPEWAAGLGAAGRTRVEATFGLDRQVAAMSALYRETARRA